MSILEIVYGVVAVAFVVVGLLLVGMAARAYLQTNQEVMLHLSVGFTLLVAAVASTAISVAITNFEAIQSMLVVQTGVSTIGLLFVAYSLVAYKQ